MGRVERLSLYLPVALSAAIYIFVGYFIERHESTMLMVSYAVLFGGYVWLAYNTKSCSVSHFIVVSIGFRLLLLFAMPSLSDDIFRFVWDGKLLAHGYNPFAALPSTLASSTLPAGLTQALYAQLNSPDYFTIYPPVAQFVFWLSVILSPDSVLGSAVVMRLLIILAEVGTIYYLLQLADLYDVARKNVVWYALNPLVILELTGNLHFEAFMILFLTAGIYYLLRNRLLLASFLFALSIATKLVPLILLPLFIRRMEWSKMWRFYLFTGLFTTLAFLPLLSTALFEGISSSLSLYFQKFEFNASIYYVMREIGFALKGYNLIGEIGPYLALTLFLLVMIFSVTAGKIKLPLAIGVVLVLYLFLSTTVHPWYLVTLLAISVLTKYRFVVVWSLLIFLTYIGYSLTVYTENLWLITIEYGIVIVYMMYEIFKVKKEEAAIECA